MGALGPIPWPWTHCFYFLILKKASLLEAELPSPPFSHIEALLHCWFCRSWAQSVHTIPPQSSSSRTVTRSPLCTHPAHMPLPCFTVLGCITRVIFKPEKTDAKCMLNAQSPALLITENGTREAALAGLLQGIQEALVQLLLIFSLLQFPFRETKAQPRERRPFLHH